jgi:hypothetical protein
MDFWEKILFLLGFSAILLPMIVLSSDILESVVFILLFIIIQTALLFLFFKDEEPGFAAWYSFFAVLVGVSFMIYMLANGRSLSLEFMAFFLFIGYVISIILIAFRDWFLSLSDFFFKNKISPGDDFISENDVVGFRNRDELSQLISAFEISEAPKKDFSRRDLEEDSYFRPLKDDLIAGEDSTSNDDYMPAQQDNRLLESEDLLESDAEEKDFFGNEDEIDKDDSNDRVEDHVEVYPKIKKDSRAIREDIFSEKKPGLDFSRFQQDIERLDTGVKGLNEKIRIISESAIVEGEARRKKKEEENNKKASVSAVNKVFASKKGTKYHFDRKCLSLKRVAKPDFVVYDDSIEARKKKLKPCKLCKN